MLWNPNIEKASPLYFSHNTWEHVDRVNVRSDRNKIKICEESCVYRSMLLAQPSCSSHASFLRLDPWILHDGYSTFTY